MDNLDDLFELITSVDRSNVLGKCGRGRGDQAPGQSSGVGHLPDATEIMSRLRLCWTRFARWAALRPLVIVMTVRSDEDGAVATAHARRNRNTEIKFLGIAKSARDIACEEALLAALERPIHCRFNGVASGGMHPRDGVGVADSDRTR